MRSLSLAAALLAAAALAGSGATAGRPSLRIAVQHPLVVAGTSFREGETVTVVAVGTFGSRSVRVRAGTPGSFRARFAKLTADPCSLRRLNAAGSLGSRAVLRLPPGACAELGAPPPG